MDTSTMSTMVGNKAQMQISGEAHFLEETMNPAKVKQMLDASKDYEKAKGMKWLLAMMSKGTDASEFFPDVVRNVIVKSVEVSEAPDDPAGDNDKDGPVIAKTKVEHMLELIE